MSLYRSKLSELSSKLEERMMQFQVPPKYSEIIKREEQYYKNHSTVSFNMIITNLHTQQDHDTIAQHLSNMNGIVGVSNFHPQKLTVAYNKYQIGLESIVYHISKLGYRYVNRF
ncbi:hypothetical protein [Alkaliphilus serpentinus]|uniref:HMA domain-containing protein n=1 Tax=Alkaliphilus serpentinus TaxID=1482731 RepID=A0A833MDA2_9FIRM|nr:hypothetical protein [Alkaliphilus serpentinus]KAB3527640.1 hypothetical protein F8153_11700 [Alkaliphilus serpentinus]